MRVVVHQAAYRILRQSRPSLRRWTASSSERPCPQRRRLLPPAAAPLETTAKPRHRGQHSAPTSDYTACGQTLRCDDATLQGRCSASASLRSAPERYACFVEDRGQSMELLRRCNWLRKQSIEVCSSLIGWCPREGQTVRDSSERSLIFLMLSNHNEERLCPLSGLLVPHLAMTHKAINI